MDALAHELKRQLADRILESGQRVIAEGCWWLPDHRAKPFDIDAALQLFDDPTTTPPAGCAPWARNVEGSPVAYPENDAAQWTNLGAIALAAWSLEEDADIDATPALALALGGYFSELDRLAGGECPPYADHSLVLSAMRHAVDTLCYPN